MQVKFLRYCYRANGSKFWEHSGKIKSGSSVVVYIIPRAMMYICWLLGNSATERRVKRTREAWRN